jgi:hypothetical protein
MRKKSVVALVVVVVLIAIQFVPVNRSNPPVRGEINAPQPVAEVLRRSCYDCHSNETHWPWYSHVAPVSWMLADHVQEARGHLNFSTWGELSDEERSGAVYEIWEQISEGKMPLRSYLIMHPDARLSDRAVETLRAWSDSFHEKDVSD